MRDSALLKNARRLSIYFGESDRWRGKPLSSALLETIRNCGGAGATLVRGVAGFGAASRIHSASILRLSEDLPLVMQVIDTPEKLDEILEIIYPMVREGMIVVEDIQVLRYTHRYLNPLPSDRLVSEVMTRDVQSLSPNTQIHLAWKKMLELNIKAMPVVDDHERVIGILTDEDLLERAGLQQRLAVAAHMQPELIEEELRSLQKLPTRVADVMSAPVITIQREDSLGLAAGRMARRRLKRMPVVDEHGKLVGMLSRLDILQQVATVKQPKLPAELPHGMVRTVQDVMRTDLPIVNIGDDLQMIVNAFIETGSQKLIVCDDSGRPVGLISDSDVVSRIQPAEQRGVLGLLRKQQVSLKTKILAEAIMSPGVITIPPQTPVHEAVRQMLAKGRKWLVVVDTHGQPLGLVDRAILLQSVAAFSEP
jgi:CBS-domain-containing membrane protein